MASYHLSVKTIKRSAGRSATAAAAYRSGSVIACDREGRVHDYSRKAGIEACFILAPEDAPEWVQDRAALWNAAEARETRKNVCDVCVPLPFDLLRVVAQVAQVFMSSSGNPPRN